MAKKEKSQRLVGQLEMPELFGRVPWGHHIDIVSRCETIDEALFYIKNDIDDGWSRPVLNVQIDGKLFKVQGSAVTNFDITLPAPQSQLAKELLKSEYNLSFISAADIQEEKDLEEALAKNVTQFLLELGKGFAYLGRQQKLHSTSARDMIKYAHEAEQITNETEQKYREQHREPDTV